MRLRSQRHQRGLSLATAIFVITVMAILAAMIFQLVRSNAESTQEEILLSRAFHAAETGVQFGLNKVFPPDPMATPAACPFVPASTGNFTFDQDGLNACTAEVTCMQVTVDSVNYITLKSKGTCGDVSRTVQVRAQ